MCYFPTDAAQQFLNKLNPSFVYYWFVCYWCFIIQNVLAQARPDCTLGHLLKILCRDDDFLNKLVNTYIMNTMEEFDLNCSAARVLLNAMPGLDSADVFKVYVMVKLIYHTWLIELTYQTSYNIFEYWTFWQENILNRLLMWAREASEPLRSYATGGEKIVFVSQCFSFSKWLFFYHYLFIYSATILILALLLILPDNGYTTYSIIYKSSSQINIISRN